MPLQVAEAVPADSALPRLRKADGMGRLRGLSKFPCSCAVA